MWLVRKSDFSIHGPMTRFQLLELIESGELDQADEICPGGGYWFFLKEQDLVEKFLYKSKKPEPNPMNGELNDISVESDWEALPQPLMIKKEVKKKRPGEEIEYESRVVFTHAKERINLRKGSDRYLFFIMSVLLVLIIAVLYYYNAILNKPLPFL